MNENDYSKPGEVWINWFSRYTKFNSELEHLFFVEWKIFFRDMSFEIEGDEVDWLLVIPITDQELTFYEEKGSQALQELLVENNIDISNLFRESLL
ncbi:suppressor of fused domain protein [Priestia megaterium]|uniref:suppressor of fused domain protein n=1 Tax=Priestia megaterium TaxID=1404 RepID=UPI003D02FCB6